MSSTRILAFLRLPAPYVGSLTFFLPGEMWYCGIKHRLAGLGSVGGGSTSQTLVGALGEGGKCHLHFTSNSLPRITSVTESERMQLQVVLKLLWVGNKHLDRMKTACVAFVLLRLIFEDTLDSCPAPVCTKDTNRRVQVKETNCSI